MSAVRQAARVGPKPDPRCECVHPPIACALHASAAELLEAAKAMFEPGPHGFDLLRAAIDKAEGR